VPPNKIPESPPRFLSPSTGLAQTLGPHPLFAWLALPSNATPVTNDLPPHIVAHTSLTLCAGVRGGSETSNLAEILRDRAGSGPARAPPARMPRQALAGPRLQPARLSEGLRSGPGGSQRLRLLVREGFRPVQALGLGP